MTLTVILLLIISLLTFYIFFSTLNPQEVTILYFWDHSLTTTVAILVVACILLGLVLGLVVHFYSLLTHQYSQIKHNRREKRERETNKLYREGINRLLSGEKDEALKLFNKSLTRDPSRIDIALALADVHSKKGETRQAVEVLQKAKDKEPKCLEILFNLAAAHEELDQFDNARDIYEEILKIESGNRIALEKFRDLRMSQSLWGDALELQKRLLKVVQGTPQYEEEKLKQTCLRYEQAMQKLEAKNFQNGHAERKEFRELIKQAPDFIPVRVALGDSYRADDRTKDAAQVWQEAYKATGKSIFLARLEDLYMEKEDPATLLSFFRSALIERNSDLLLHFFFGKLCLRLEMVDEALEQLIFVENAGLELPQLHLLLAEAYRRRDRTDESNKEFQKAMVLKQDQGMGYLCGTCGTYSPAWQSRCPECKNWGSYRLADYAVFQNVKPAEGPPQMGYSGEGAEKAQ